MIVGFLQPHSKLSVYPSMSIHKLSVCPSVSFQLDWSTKDAYRGKTVEEALSDTPNEKKLYDRIKARQVACKQHT